MQTLEKYKKKNKKINTIFNINNNKINEINEDYKNRSFGEVMGQINLDLEKLFKKYRPDSDEDKKKKEN